MLWSNVVVNIMCQIDSEKAMAAHSSTLARKIPWTEEPHRLQFMGSLRVGHNWTTSLSLFPFMHWRRRWQPTPVFLPGESQGQESLVGCRLWGCTELDTTKAMQQLQQAMNKLGNSYIHLIFELLLLWNSYSNHLLIFLYVVCLFFSVYRYLMVVGLMTL